MCPSRIAELLDATRLLGPEMNDHTHAESQRIWSQARRDSTGVREELDLAYGPDPRHQLDIYRTDKGCDKPVFVFVHGGGFTGGSKRKPGSYLYGNIGTWAARHGMIGVNITYRLAPAHPWPAAMDDLQRALQWIEANIVSRGGDRSTIILAGHSAGATHVAGFLAHERNPSSVSAAVLFSGAYDIVAAASRPSIQSYFGMDPEGWKQRSPMPALARTRVPLLIAVAENDPAAFREQATSFMAHWQGPDASRPSFIDVPAHNHFSMAYHIGSEDRRFTSAMLDFFNSRAAVRLP